MMAEPINFKAAKRHTWPPTCDSPYEFCVKLRTN
jgi:hypothetical protein